jgi:hypothetical protein
MVSPHLLALDIKSGKVLSRFGKDVSDSGVFNDPMVSAYRVPADSGLWAYDFQTRKLWHLDWRVVGSPKVLSEVTLSIVEKPLFVVPTDAGAIANGMFEDDALVLFGKDGRPVTRVGNPPFKGQGGGFQLNNGILAADPGRAKVALVYQHVSRVDFFRTDGASIGTVDGPRPTRASFRFDSTRKRLFWNSDNEMGYIAAAATERYVYAAFCGCADGRRPETRYLHVFRWNGDFVGEFVVDRPILEFTVAPNDSLMYGVFGSPRPNVVGEWRLPFSLSRSARDRS